MGDEKSQNDKTEEGTVSQPNAKKQKKMQSEGKKSEPEENEGMELDSKREKGKGKVEGKPSWWRDVSVMNENQKKKYFRSMAIRKYKKMGSKKKGGGSSK